MLNSILYFLYALAYSIYVLFLSFGCLVIFLVLVAGILTIASFIDRKKEKKNG